MMRFVQVLLLMFYCKLGSLVDFAIPPKAGKPIEQALCPDNNQTCTDSVTAPKVTDRLLYVDVFDRTVDCAYLVHQTLLLPPCMKVARRLLYKRLVYSACLCCVAQVRRCNNYCKIWRIVDFFVTTMTSMMFFNVSVIACNQINLHHAQSNCDGYYKNV